MNFNNYLPEKFRRIFFTGTALLFLGVSLTSCLKNDDDDYVPQYSNVTIVNAYPNATNGIFWYYGNSFVNSTAFSYPSGHYYKGLYSGTYIAFTEGNSTSSTLVAEGSAPGTGEYSFFIAGKGDSSFVMQDKFITPAAGKAAIRFVNASKDAGAVDATIADAGESNLSFSNIAQKNNSDFKEFDSSDAASTVTVSVFATGTTTNPLATQTFTIKAGSSYTFFLSGYKTGTNVLALKIGQIDHTTLMASTAE